MKATELLDLLFSYAEYDATNGVSTLKITDKAKSTLYDYAARLDSERQQ